MGIYVAATIVVMSKQAMQQRNPIFSLQDCFLAPSLGFVQPGPHQATPYQPSKPVFDLCEQQYNSLLLKVVNANEQPAILLIFRVLISTLLIMCFFPPVPYS